MTPLLWFLLLPLAAYAAYALLSVWAAAKWHRARTPVNRDWTPAVTILKPVCGIDAEAYANFASFCRLDYPADKLQIVFGALDRHDPALELARRLQCDFPDVDIAIVFPKADVPQGFNLKVCNFISMFPAARHDLLVLCDSDMRVQPDYLRRVVAPFQSGSVGLVTCPYRGFRPQSFAAILEALGIGADFIPSALASRALEGVTFAFGSTIALPRHVLAEIGGFEALKDQLADDFRLGNGVHNAGYTVVLSDYVVDDLLGAEKFGAMWARRLRWARTTRSCRPAGYAGAVITHGLAFALLFLLASGFTSVGWLVFGSVLALRLLTAAVIAGRFTRDANVLRYLLLLPLGDLFSFALYVWSFCGNRLLWRGEHFRLLSGGRLAPLPPKKQAD